jgi:Holliday junction resolvasome RuvABC endonuclease subunit
MKRIWLSIDPASHACGVALWTPEGQFIASNVFRANEQETFRRYYRLRESIWMWVEETLGPDYLVIYCVIEQIPKLVTGDPALPFSASALLTHAKNVSDMKEHNMIAPQSWKYVARMMGAGEKPKGIVALKQMGWTWKTPANDDEADAILIYIGHQIFNGRTVYFSPTDARRLKSGAIPK